MKKIFTLIAVAFASLTSFAQHAEWTAAQLPQALFADKAAAEAAGFNTMWWSEGATADWLGMPAQDLIKTDWVTVSLATPYSYVSKGNGKYSGKAYAYKLIMGMNNSTRDGIDPLFFLEGVQNNDYVRKTGDSDQGNVINDAIIKIVTEKTPEGVDPWTYAVTMRINRADNMAAFYVVDATKSKMVVQTTIRNMKNNYGDDVIRFNIEQGHEYYCMASESGSVELYGITVCDPNDADFEVVANEENTTALWTADMLPTTKFASVDEAVAAGFNTLWGSGDWLGMPAQDLIKNDEVTVSLANPYNAVYAQNKIGGGKKHTYKIIMGMNNSTRDGIDPLFFLEGVQNNDYVRKTADSDQGNAVYDAIIKIDVAPNAEGTDPYCSRMIFNYSRGNNNGAFYVVDATKSIPVYQDVTRMDNKIEKKQSAIINVYPGRTYYVMASDKSSVEL
ncbi:MAG: hypothetical protein J6Q93_01010, partial [Prevotella sp.]|nr:hypothetical protein [Prevotella sp.]